jgi:hypothetical protein
MTDISRRDFIQATGAGLLTIIPRETPVSLQDTLEQRVARLLQAYDAQGNHRTGTEVDRRSGEWLAREVRQAGTEASLEPFSLSRVDPQSCYLQTGGRRMDGVPVFDATFTGAQGVHGKLGPLGSDSEIGLAESELATLSEGGGAPPRTGIEQPEQVQVARRSGHSAVVILTRGVRPGLHLLNASDFRKPSGPPMLQISSSEIDWLRERAAARDEATLVAQVNGSPAEAFNITVKVAGRNPALAPIVLMAPRSAWWQSVTEQGSRLVCWLEAIRVLTSAKPARDCFFVALSGHELGFLGIDAYLQRRPGVISRARCWIFLGSGLGSPCQPNLVHASDDALERWAISALEKEGIAVHGTAPHDSKARGEAGAIQRGGGRFLTVVSASDVYHNVNDRWPEAVDVGLLARYARAFADGVLRLATEKL